MNVYNESHMCRNEKKKKSLTRQKARTTYREVTETWHLVAETSILVGKGHLSPVRWLRRFARQKNKTQ